MHFDDGRVQRDSFNPDADDLLALQLLEHAIQHAALGPSIHTCVNGVPITETLRQPAPLATVLGHVQNRVQHREICHAHIAALARQTDLNATVLSFRDLHLLTISQINAVV